jgi:hypothetical protein
MILSDSEEWHVYIISNGLLDRMNHKENDASADPTPSAVFSKH